MSKMLVRPKDYRKVAIGWDADAFQLSTEQKQELNVLYEGSFNGYKPGAIITGTIIAATADGILVDINYISGHKLGWYYDIKNIKDFATKFASNKYKIKYVDPKEQNVEKYIDMIYSSKGFISVLSGGAALAAALQKEAVIFLPKNVRGESVYNFVFKKSKIKYISWVYFLK